MKWFNFEAFSRNNKSKIILKDFWDQCCIKTAFPLFQQKFETEAQEVAGSQFSVSQQESSSKTAVFENALDIKVSRDQFITDIGEM